MESVAQHVSSDWLIAARSDDAAAPRRHPMSRTGLFTRWRQWLTQLSVRWQAEALDPRMARDIGAAPGNPMPEGYICDPRPLWHIGLAPESIHSAAWRTVTASCGGDHRMRNALDLAGRS